MAPSRESCIKQVSQFREEKHFLENKQAHEGLTPKEEGRLAEVNSLIEIWMGAYHMAAKDA